MKSTQQSVDQLDCELDIGKIVKSDDLVFSSVIMVLQFVEVRTTNEVALLKKKIFEPEQTRVP